MDIVALLAEFPPEKTPPTESPQLELFPNFDYSKFKFPNMPAPTSCAEEQGRMTIRLCIGDKTTICGTCGQKVGIYGRPFNRGYARPLVSLVAQFERDERWYHAKEFNCTGGGDYAKLLGYEFIEKRPNDDPDKTSSANFRPTRRGIEAAHGRIAFPKRSFWFGGMCFGFGEDRVLIHECTENFSIRDLWDEAVAKIGHETHLT